MDVPSNKLRKGTWTVDEDNLLRQCIEQYGEGTWHKVPLRAGLNRCRKSCRLRWLNYLKPSIKRGRLSSDEIDLLLRLHKLLGNRWSLIAGRLPGRTANDIKNYWNTYLSKIHDPSPTTNKRKKKKVESSSTKPNQKVEVIKPKPRSFSSSQQKVDSSGLSIKDCVVQDNNNNNNNMVCDHDHVTCNKDDELVNSQMKMDRETMWLESLLEENEVANMAVPEEAEGSLMSPEWSTLDVEQLWKLLDEDE